MTDESTLWASAEAWPKYPVMTVSGVAVSRDLAREIIRRIDVTFQGYGPPTNDEYWKDEFHRRLRMPRWSPEDTDPLSSEKTRTAFEAWRRDWAVIPLDYTYTDWVSSACGDGPSGWIHPSGRIGYEDHVASKNPTPEELVAEWRLIADTFPQLSLAVWFSTVSGGVSEDPGPLMQLQVRDGCVVVVPRDQTVNTENHDPVLRGPWRPSDNEMLRDPRWARGCPESWIDEWEKKAQEIAWTNGRTT